MSASPVAQILLVQSMSASLMTSILATLYVVVFYRGKFRTKVAILQLTQALLAFARGTLNEILAVGFFVVTWCPWGYFSSTLYALLELCTEVLLLLGVLSFVSTRRRKIAIVVAYSLFALPPRIASLFTIRRRMVNGQCIPFTNPTIVLVTICMASVVSILIALFFSVVLFRQSRRRPQTTGRTFRRLGRIHGISFITLALFRVVTGTLFLIGPLGTYRVMFVDWSIIVELVLVNLAIHFSLDNRGREEFRSSTTSKPEGSSAYSHDVYHTPKSRTAPTSEFAPIHMHPDPPPLSKPDEQPTFAA